MNKFAKAVQSILPTTKLDALSEAEMSLLETAEQCDMLATRLHADLVDMGKRFTAAAEEVAASGSPEDPTGYSTLRDISKTSAQLEQAQQHLGTALRLAYTTAPPSRFRFTHGRVVHNLADFRSAFRAAFEAE